MIPGEYRRKGGGLVLGVTPSLPGPFGTANLDDPAADEPPDTARRPARPEIHDMAGQVPSGRRRLDAVFAAYDIDDAPND